MDIRLLLESNVIGKKVYDKREMYNTVCVCVFVRACVCLYACACVDLCVWGVGGQSVRER